jgi:hypothetical protein
MKDDFNAPCPGFINGNSDALLRATKWADANEDAYFYTSKLEFYQSVNMLKHDVPMLIDSGNSVKYAGQREFGNTVLSDYTGAKQAKLKDHNFPAHLCVHPYKLTAAERAI